jgi:nucleotide-binding universal stress UspA family protein
MSDHRSLVICYDGSDNSRHAIEEAARLHPGARAIVLHVWESIESTMAYRYSLAGVTGALEEAMTELQAAGAEEAAKLAQEGATLAIDAGLLAEPLVEQSKGHAWTAAVELVQSRDASLVVVGSKGRGPLRALSLGSFASGVVHHSMRPVLVVPQPQ